MAKSGSPLLPSTAAQIKHPAQLFTAQPHFPFRHKTRASALEVWVVCSAARTATAIQNRVLASATAVCQADSGPATPVTSALCQRRAVPIAQFCVLTEGATTAHAVIEVCATTERVCAICLPLASLAKQHASHLRTLSSALATEFVSQLNASAAATSLGWTAQSAARAGAAENAILPAPASPRSWGSYAISLVPVPTGDVSAAVALAA